MLTLVIVYSFVNDTLLGSMIYTVNCNYIIIVFERYMDYLWVRDAASHTHTHTHTHTHCCGVCARVNARGVAGLRCDGGQHKPAAACGASIGPASPSAVAFSLSVASCCLESCDKSPNV
jgi:hypothetical protein